MRLLILDKENYVSFDLPFNVYGNYWITIPQKNNKIKNLINVEEENNLWKIRKNEHVNIIINKNYVDSITLTDYFLCYLEDIDTKEIYILYTEPSYDKTFMLLENTSDNITVGRNINSSVSYNSVYVKENQIKITKNNGNWLFENIDLTIPVYINKKRVSKCYLKNGDLIFVMGLKIIITGNYLIVNNPNNLCKTNILLKKYEILELNYDDTESEEEIPLYSENDYYFRSPRFRNIIEPENIKIDEPPSKPEENEMPMKIF